MQYINNIPCAVCTVEILVQIRYLLKFSLFAKCGSKFTRSAYVTVFRNDSFNQFFTVCRTGADYLFGLLVVQFFSRVFFSILLPGQRKCRFAVVYYLLCVTSSLSTVVLPHARNSPWTSYKIILCGAKIH